MKSYEELQERINFFQLRIESLNEGEIPPERAFNRALDLVRAETALQTLLWIKDLLDAYTLTWDAYVESKKDRFGRRKTDHIYFHIPELMEALKEASKEQEQWEKSTPKPNDDEGRKQEAAVKSRAQVFSWLFQDYFGYGPSLDNMSKYLRRWTDQFAKLPESESFMLNRDQQPGSK